MVDFYKLVLRKGDGRSPHRQRRWTPQRPFPCPGVAIPGRWLIGLISILAIACFSLSSPALADPLQESPSKQAFRVGVDAFQQADYAGAVEAFTQAIQAQPDYGAAYGNRCLSYLEWQHYDQAIADCTTALDLSANPIEAYLNRGLAYYRLGRSEDAIADYTALLQRKPHDHRAHYNRGLAWMEQGDYRNALVDYGEALRQVSPLDRISIALIHIDRGIAYEQLDQYREAIAAFTQAIQVNATDGRAFFNRGCAYHYLGNDTAALEDFTQATLLDPDHAQAYLHRGLIRYQMGQPEAIADLQQAAQAFQSQGSLSHYQQTLRLIRHLQPLPMAVG